MRRNPIIWAMALIACLAVVISIGLAVVDRHEQFEVAKTLPVPFSIESWKVDLESDSRERRVAAHRRAKGNMKVLREYLRERAAEDTAHHTDFFATRALAMDLLQPESDQEDIAVLIRHITYRHATLVSRPSPLNGYPAATTLIRYGPTAPYCILDYLRVEPVEEVSDQAMHLYALVCFSVFHATDSGDQESLRVVEAAIARDPQCENHARLLVELKEVAARWHPPRKKRGLPEKIASRR